MDAAKEVVKEALDAPKELSKRALEKAKKKAEKAEKKKEYAARSKPAASTSTATATATAAPVSVFEEGWLKRVYEEKPVGRGHVRTRFPPEPNGYLHIGHAKAIAVNFGFAKHYDGVCFLRYDDTNPEKEEEVYFSSILEIVEWLGFQPYKITHSSDSFDRLYELAEELIRRDKGYVCHCSKEEVKLQRGGADNRGPRFGCKHRDRPVDESLAEFRGMRDGKYAAGEAFLRMKQSLTDPNEGNPQMWDLPAYRVTKNKSHARTGDKWRIYPTYDFAHCLCDSFEDISHSLCTTEFFLSRTSYDWLLEVLDIKKPRSDEEGPMQREYGRLNVAGTILSKRRIQMLVEGAIIEDPNDPTQVLKKVPPAVRSWDDPRLYTLVALRRRGVPAPALLQFVQELGVTDALTNILIARLESTIRKYLERTVPRLMLILDPVLVIVEDLADDYSDSFVVPYDPKKQDGNKRKMTISKKLYIDREDFREDDDPNFFRLAPGKAVGLQNAPFLIKAKSFSKDQSGSVVEIIATKIPLDAEKPKAFIHWVDESTAVGVVARQYNPLFTTDNPNELDWKEGGYTKSLNPDSEVVWKDGKVEQAFRELLEANQTSSRQKPEITTAKAADTSAPSEGGEHKMDEAKASDNLVRFQAVRTAYFCLDPDSIEGKPVLNQIVTLKEDKTK